MRRKIAILGRTGRLGGALCRALSQKHEVVELGRQEVDLTSSVSEQLKNVEFDLFINTAAITNLDWCEQNPRAAERVNAVAVGELGAICYKRGVRCVHISTDYVFDGSASSPCREEQPASPINVYGKAKRLGEELLLKADNRHLVVTIGASPRHWKEAVRSYVRNKYPRVINAG